MTPPKEKRSGTWKIWPYTKAHVMAEYIEANTWLQRNTIQSQFSRNKKKLTDYKEVYEFIENKKKKKRERDFYKHF